MNLQKAFIPTDGVSRETREGWPLLTVETEVNGTQRGQMRGVLSCLVCWVYRADFYSASTALVGPVQNVFFSLSVQYFNTFFPIAHAASWAVGSSDFGIRCCFTNGMVKLYV